MIRALASDGDRPVVILGLDPENMARMRDGQPIKVNLHNLDPGGKPTDLPDIDVVILFAGEDEARVLMDAFKRSAGT